MDPVRRELDALGAGLMLVREELAQVRREQTVDHEQTYKRLVWYSYLEQLAICAVAFCKAGSETRMERETELREMAERISAVHRYISPAVLTDEQETARAEDADVLPWVKPA